VINPDASKSERRALIGVSILIAQDRAANEWNVFMLVRYCKGVIELHFRVGSTWFA
jgi:hypothetical protein